MRDYQAGAVHAERHPDVRKGMGAAHYPDCCGCLTHPILSRVLPCVFMRLGLALSADKTPSGGNMRGIDFVTNKRGQKTAVLIDLKRHGQLCEDFYDSVAARNRAREPRESLDAVKDRLRRLDKLRG
jgi:hypothetical protein